MTFTQLTKAVSDRICMDRVQQRAKCINDFEKTYRARDFEKSSLYCEQLLKDAGFERVERYPLPMDGVTCNLDCIMPQAWDIEPGSFCRIEDADIPENFRMIADYAKDHFSCGLWSAPTPPEGLDAELVDVRNITDATPLDGKFILATENTLNWYKRGVKRNAAGILIYDGKPEAARDFPDHRRWGNGYGLYGWYPAKDERRLVIYHITPHQGEFLHGRLKKSPLHLHAVMNSKIFDGNIWTVTGIIPGKTSEEITLLAHIYEPFMTDDAIGAAASVEICTILRDLAKDRIIGQLKKTLRVVFSMELYGFSEYFAKPENVRRTYYAVSLDGIGTFNTWKEDERKTVNIRLTSGASPFISDLLYRAYFEETGTVNTLETRGNLSDDTFGQDPMILRFHGTNPNVESGIPVNWLRTCILPYHHNTSPMYQRVDSVLAKEVIKAYCTILSLFATEDHVSLEAYFPKLIELANRELKEISDQSKNQMEKKELDARQSNEQVLFWRELEKKILLTANQIVPGFVSAEKIEEVLYTPEKIRGEMRPLTSNEEKASHWIVQRLTPGMIHSFSRVPLAEKDQCPGTPACLSQIMIYFDGERDLLTAVRMAQYDQRTKTYTEKQWETLFRFLEFLEKYGYFHIEKR